MDALCKYPCWLWREKYGEWVKEWVSMRAVIFTLFCSRLASRFLWVRKWSLAVPLAAGWTVLCLSSEGKLGQNGNFTQLSLAAVLVFEALETFSQPLRSCLVIVVFFENPSIHPPCVTASAAAHPSRQFIASARTHVPSSLQVWPVPPCGFQGGRGQRQTNYVGSESTTLRLLIDS